MLLFKKFVPMGANGDGAFWHKKCNNIIFKYLYKMCQNAPSPLAQMKGKKMLKKVLIANRGEIAVRIIRACREMGIRTVAVYSEIDKDSLHRKMADESVCIGPAKSAVSYLNVKNILEAACLTGADSIHPGFGFLSESSTFAKMCDEIGIKFIGPSYKLIELMGNKSMAKETMQKAGVPVVPGSDGLVKDIDEAKSIGEKIGYPIIIKASSRSVEVKE